MSNQRRLKNSNIICAVIFIGVKTHVTFKTITKLCSDKRKIKCLFCVLIYNKALHKADKYNNNRQKQPFTTEPMILSIWWLWRQSFTNNMQHD